MRILFLGVLICISNHVSASESGLINDRLNRHPFDSLNTSKHADSLKNQYKDSLHVSLEDSISVPTSVDTLVPLQHKGLLSSSQIGEIFTGNEFHQEDYRYTGNIFTYLPFGLLQDLGSLGQPHEVKFYGLGFNNISYLSDDIPINNRLNNSLDLNHYQSENIDSLEVIPLPRGFLYGNSNNPITVNFITKDKINPIPNSRLRVYLGKDEEGLVDLGFGAYVVSRLNISFRITSNSIENRYINSDFESWKTFTRFRYMPGNKLNIIGSYSFVKSRAALNGGVDLDSIKNRVSESEVTSLLYNNVQAPVNYIDRYQKTKKHNLNLKLLGNLIKNSPTDLTFYYQFNLTEFRQNEFADQTSQASIPVIFDDNKYKTIGGNFKQIFNFNFINVQFLSNYEQVEYIADILKLNETRSKWSIAGKANLNLLNGMIIPSAFAKQLNYSDINFSGYGGDININISNKINLYAGVSKYEKPLSMIEEQYLDSAITLEKQEITSFEAGTRFKLNFLTGSISYFNFENNNQPTPVIDIYSNALKINEIGFYTKEKFERAGFNLNLNLKLWKILLSANTSYYFRKNNDHRQTPENTIAGGIYYIDTLFNANLKLKTGFNIKYYGEQDYFTYDFEKSTAVAYQLNSLIANSEISLIRNESTSSAFQLDFFLAGKIQDLAIFYFVFENLLNEEYYIAPYYPKQSRGVRFGVSWELLN